MFMLRYCMNIQSDKELYYPYQYYTLNVARVIVTQNQELQKSTTVGGSSQKGQVETHCFLFQSWRSRCAAFLSFHCFLFVLQIKMLQINHSGVLLRSTISPPLRMLTSLASCRVSTHSEFIHITLLRGCLNQLQHRNCFYLWKETLSQMGPSASFAPEIFLRSSVCAWIYTGHKQLLGARVHIQKLQSTLWGLS